MKYIANKTVSMSMDEYRKLHPDPVQEMKDKYAAQDKALKEWDNLMDYCRKQNCSFRDLINAHKKHKV